MSANYKVIYGLCQALHTWYYELNYYVLSHRFTASMTNSSLFILNSTTTPIFFLVYVDISLSSDLLLLVLIHSFTIPTRFSLKDYLELLSYILGEVLSHPKGILLTQRK